MTEVIIFCATTLAVAIYAAIRFEVAERRSQDDLVSLLQSFSYLNHMVAKNESTLHVLSLSVAAAVEDLRTMRDRLVEIEAQTKSWEVVKEPVFVARACDPKSK